MHLSHCSETELCTQGKALFRKLSMYLGKNEFGKRLRSSTELRVLRSLSHNNVVALLQEEAQDDLLVLEACVCDLHALVQRYRDVGYEDGRGMIAPVKRQLLSALTHVHNKGFVHNDVSPDNVLVRSFSPLTIVLADFDAAAPKGQRVTRGKPAFCPPERLQVFACDIGWPCCPSGDLWAAALTLIVVYLLGGPFLTPLRASGWPAFASLDDLRAGALAAAARVPAPHSWLLEALLHEQPDVRVAVSAQIRG